MTIFNIISSTSKLVGNVHIIIIKIHIFIVVFLS